MLELREHQQSALQKLREGFEQGHTRQLLYAPTGAGKTECAIAIMNEYAMSYQRSAMVMDRIVLVEQTSLRLGKYQIDHGVMQSSHWRYRPSERIQICSIQTLAKRKKMANLYTNVVSAIPTEKLVEKGLLCPLKVYIAKEIDMTGAKKIAGEWSADDVTTRGMKITGDIVSEWVKKTHEIFGEPKKTIVFCSGVDHGRDLEKQFNAAGYNFVSISYKEDDDFKRMTIEDFSRPDTTINGLIATDILTKGFDVSDVRIGISARPFSKSFSSHVQQIGRILRPHEGKDFGGALETAGGIARALPLLCDGASNDAEIFWLLAGDVYVPDFEFDGEAAQRFAVSGRLAHLWLVPNPDHNPLGDFGLQAVPGDGAQTHLALNLSKDSPLPRYTYSTIGLFSKALFLAPWCDIPSGNPLGAKAALAPLLRRAMDQGQVSAQIYTGRWTDVGTPERLRQLHS